MAFVSLFQRSFSAAFDRAAAAAAAPAWYVVAGKTCVAAYQPKGAASLAASYTNLANPGTYDAAPGVAPTWDAVGGWTGGTGVYLTTTLIPANDQTWSWIVRYSDVPSGNAYLFGSVNTSGGNCAFSCNPNRAVQGVTYINGYSSGLQVLPPLAGGVLAVAGTAAYRDGAADAGVVPARTGPTANLAIDALGLNLNGAHFGYTCKIQALAIYSATLTAGEVAAVSAAMAAL